MTGTKLTLNLIAKKGYLGVSLEQMIEAIERAGCTWAVSGGNDFYEGVIFKETKKSFDEWRAHRKAPKDALYEAICSYVALKATRHRELGRKEAKGQSADRGSSAP